MIFMSWLPQWDVPFDPAIHATEECEAHRLVIRDTIGQAATVEIEIVNPGAGGLLARQERYAVFSERGPDDEVATELARGRMVGVPSNFATDFVTCKFICAPPSDDEVQRAYADTLRTEDEWYDPVYHGRDASEEPSTALSARPREWYWNRRTLSLGTTHLTKGTRTLDMAAEVFDESMTLSLPESPVPLMRRRLVFGWTQSASGMQSSPVQGGPFTVSTYTAGDFMGSFPKAGDSIGSDTGWSWAVAEVKDLGPGMVRSISAPGIGVTGAAVSAQPRTLQLMLHAQHEYSQQREEVVDIFLPLGIQPVVGDDRRDDLETIQVSGLTTDETTPEWEWEDSETLEPMEYEVGDRRMANGSAWECVRDHTVDGDRFRVKDPSSGETLWVRADKDVPLDARAASYVNTDRGLRSVHCAIHTVEREALLMAQCARFGGEVPWELAREATVDDELRVEGRYLSGAAVIGKILDIELEADDTGHRVARFNLGCIPGNGAPQLPPDEEFDQVAGDIAYKVTGKSASVPVDCYALRIRTPRILEWRNQGAAQLAAMFVASDPEAELSTRATQLVIGYDPLREEDLLTRRLRITCRPLALPRQIDLESEA